MRKTEESLDQKKKRQRQNVKVNIISITASLHSLAKVSWNHCTQ